MEYRRYISGERRPARASEGAVVAVDLAYACNAFLAAKDGDVQAGELSPRSFADYRRTCARWLKFLGRDRHISTLCQQDFSDYKSHFRLSNNPVSVGNEVTRIKTMIKWLHAHGLAGPIDTGPDFRKPSRLTVRKIRESQQKKLFSSSDINFILDECGVHLRAMVMLGINCGFGNNDCNQLPLANVHAAIVSGWLEFPRPKTLVARRIPIWQSTRDALQSSVNRRRDCKLPYAFITHRHKQYSSVNCDISKLFRIARDHAGLSSGGFYWLRHTFATIASSCGDQVAVNAIMGHVDSSISQVYRECVQDDRLKKATQIVADWLGHIHNPTE